MCENLNTPQLQKIFGNITSFGNNVQIGYLKGIDILGITYGTTGIVKFKIIEIKIDNVTFDHIKQTLGYVDWIIEHLSSGNPKFVNGYIVAKSFDSACVDFVKNHNIINQGRRLHLVKFDYVGPNYRTLNIQKKV